MSKIFIQADKKDIICQKIENCLREHQMGQLVRLVLKFGRKLERDVFEL